MPDPIPPDPRRHAVPAVPPPTLASPSEVARSRDVPFWRPGWGEAWRYVGYRWVFLLPAAGVVGLLVCGLFVPNVWWGFWYLGPKLAITCLAVPFVLAGWVLATAIRGRADPFCIHCGYGLSGLPDDHACPECGRPYNFRVIDEYRRDPRWFAQRWRQEHPAATHAPLMNQTTGPRKKSRDGT